MGILHRIDLAILQIVDRFCWWMAEWFGITKNTLARLCISVFGALMVATHFYRIFFDDANYPFFTNVLKIIIALNYITFVFGFPNLEKLMNSSQENGNEGAISPLQLGLANFRVKTFVISTIIFFSCSDYEKAYQFILQWIDEGQTIKVDYLLSFCTVVKQFLVLLALYFLGSFAIPPKKTKVAKAKEKINEILSPQPQLAMQKM